MRDPTEQIRQGAIGAGPAAAATLWDSLLNLPLEKWLTAVLIIYTVLQCYFLLRDRFSHKNRRTDKTK